MQNIAECYVALFGTENHFANSHQPNVFSSYSANLVTTAEPNVTLISIAHFSHYYDSYSIRLVK